MVQFKVTYIAIFFFFAMVLGIVTFWISIANVPAHSQPARVATEVREHTQKQTLPAYETVRHEQYVQIVDSCGPWFESSCATAHAGPGNEHRVVSRLRNGVVLKIEQPVLSSDGLVWYKIAFDEWLRYPERLNTEWYIAGEHVRVFQNNGLENLTEENVATSTKYILIDRSDQRLYAYEDDELFMIETISTGIELTPTPRGTFTIFRKTPTRYMQGPLPGISSKYYDLPGVPWNLYFTQQGGVIHGTYWHDKFGQKWSNGCVNVPTDQAEKLYTWADIGIPVIVRD